MEHPDIVHIYHDKTVEQLVEVNYDDWVLREAARQIADRFGGLELVEKYNHSLDNRGAYRPGIPEMTLLNTHKPGISEYVIKQAAVLDGLEKERLAREAYKHIFRDTVHDVLGKMVEVTQDTNDRLRLAGRLLSRSVLHYWNDKKT